MLLITSRWFSLQRAISSLITPNQTECKCQKKRWLLFFGFCNSCNKPKNKCLRKFRQRLLPWGQKDALCKLHRLCVYVLGGGNTFVGLKASRKDDKWQSFLYGLCLFSCSLSTPPPTALPHSKENIQGSKALTEVLGARITWITLFKSNSRA